MADPSFDVRDAYRAHWPAPDDMTDEALASYLEQLEGMDVTMVGDVVGKIIRAWHEDGWIKVEWIDG